MRRGIFNKEIKIDFMFATKVVQEAENPQIDGKSTKRKRPLQVASLEGEALISRELDS